MNICFFGQGTGGNAVLWFDYLNKHLCDHSEISQFTFVCRTVCTLDANFHVLKPYGTGKIPHWLNRYYVRWVKFVGLRYTLSRLVKKTPYDILHLQGNYVPSLNLQIIDALRCPFVLNIYGSDFYRQYLLGNFTRPEKARFEEVVRCADHIVCNWISTESDFVKAFPDAANKCSSHFWGYDEKWKKPAPPLTDWPEAEKVFLSARGVYDYNNIDTVVDAFCRAYKDKPSYKLFIVNGYGNHVHAIEKVKALIETHNAHDQVIMRVGQWITNEELMALYERADYNLCFGSTDQLTISICYGCEKNAVNILSPLKNYHDLRDMGYQSLQIVDAISVEALEEHFKNLPTPNSKALENDKALVRQHFNMQNTFDCYMDIYRKIVKEDC